MAPRIGQTVRINDPILGISPGGTLLAWTTITDESGQLQTMGLIDLGVKGGAYTQFPGCVNPTFIRTIVVHSEYIEADKA
jgi:hypothetical protein